MAYNELDKKTLFIANLPTEAHESHVRELYEKYGHIVSCFIVRARGTDRSRGLAFVEFERHEQAEAALSTTNGMKFWDNLLRVQWAKPLSPEEKERKARLTQRKQSQDMMNPGPISPISNGPPNPRELYRRDSMTDIRDMREMRDMRDLRDMRDMRHDSRDLRDLRDLRDRDRDLRDRDLRERDLRDSIRDMRDIHHENPRMIDERMINDYRMEPKFEPKIIDEKGYQSQRSPPPPPQLSPLHQTTDQIPQVPTRQISTRLYQSDFSMTEQLNVNISQLLAELKERESILEKFTHKSSGRTFDDIQV